LVTGVGTQLTLTPDKYELAQNYPNPFNPTTKINFSLPKQGFVSLNIFDVTGREVAKLVNEVTEAGYHSVDFNASNFASGVYFYRIEAGEFTDTRRMMLIK
ncbi:MAG: T9SS type A sorting domain-containing protein, partial [Bacteroidetes bacterium]|nr:T9SS type A sorting domain-containing protein [Bacteroidota bacterium]